MSVSEAAASAAMTIFSLIAKIVALMLRPYTRSNVGAKHEREEFYCLTRI